LTYYADPLVWIYQFLNHVPYVHAVLNAVENLSVSHNKRMID